MHVSESRVRRSHQRTSLSTLRRPARCRTFLQVYLENNLKKNASQISQDFTLFLYNREVLFCLVRQQSLTCILDCFFLQTVHEFYSLFTLFFVLICWGFAVAHTGKHGCFSANQRAPSRREKLFGKKLFLSEKI